MVMTSLQNGFIHKVIFHLHLFLLFLLQLHGQGIDLYCNSLLT